MYRNIKARFKNPYTKINSVVWTLEAPKLRNRSSRCHLLSHSNQFHPLPCTVTIGLVLPNSVPLLTGQAFYEALAIVDAGWTACCHKSRCQLAAQLTADLWCVWARQGTVSSLQVGRSPLWKRKQCWLQVGHLINPLQTNHKLHYLKAQFIPWSEHFSSRL
jgi:hypothetical protein